MKKNSKNEYEELADPQWRLNHIYSVVNKAGQRVGYFPNSIQRLILKEHEKRKMILKARQFGVSTHCLIELLDFTMFNPDVTTCILAHEQDAIAKLFRIPTRAYEFLPEELKPRLSRGGGSKYEMYFPKINSRIYCDLSVRGDTIQRLHVSEAAFIKDQDELLATLQAVPLDGYVTLETTPNGMGSYYYDMWSDPKQQYSKLFFPWYLFPDYQIPCAPLEMSQDEVDLCHRVKAKYGFNLSYAQINYRRTKQSELGKLFAQEYPEDDITCFLASGSAAINLFKVKEQMDKKKSPIAETATFRQFVPYKKDRLYVCGADPAEGVGGDSSVGVIMDAKTREECAVIWSNQWSPYQFAHELDDFCKLYTSGGRPLPLLGVERNNHGHAVLLELEFHIQYENLFYTDEERTRAGWLSDKVTRPILMDCFIDGVENRTIILHDPDTHSECLTLIVENGKAQAAKGKHDDRVMATGVAVQMCIECAPLAIYDNIKDKILL